MIVRKKHPGWWIGPLRLWWHGGRWIWRPGFTDWRPEGRNIIAGGWLGLEWGWFPEPDDRYYREPLLNK